ncbi:WecB/TagA/CpsF family glycosyltransferase [Caldalkalibacillus mannanilyticus]|uniref:WecB/TagA/CpsF family glycosyltransferase n=1 Tax=Caldalkalibacillus mannanilyticus TaxID=1418 RepID=UPI0006874649|nr:WecB/TagA/CpsF family glycosyltransferase [Caldalkalibacillus mannanilyticus]
MEIKKVRILDKPIHIINMEQTIQYLREKTEQGEKQFIIAQNPEKIMKSLEDEELSTIIEEKATLLIADGIGLVIAAKLLGLPSIPRVTGVGLFEEMVKVAHQDQKSLFLYGASPEVNEKAEEVLKQRYPDIRIAGRLHGYEKDTAKVLSAIQEAAPDYLFVALGSPGQEKWIAKYLDELPVRLVMGVGGTLDVLTGNVKRAPVWMQKLGIEWLHRLLKQPTRAGRMMNLPKFMLKVLKNR